MKCCCIRDGCAAHRIVDVLARDPFVQRTAIRVRRDGVKAAELQSVFGVSAAEIGALSSLIGIEHARLITHTAQRRAHLVGGWRAAAAATQTLRFAYATETGAHGVIHLLSLADDVAVFGFTRRFSVHGANLELATDVKGRVGLRVAQSLEIFCGGGADLRRIVLIRPFIGISPDIMPRERANAVDAAAAHLRSPLCPEPVGRAGSCFGFAVAVGFGGRGVASGRVKPAPVLVAPVRRRVLFANGRGDTGIRAHLFGLCQRGEVE